MTSVISALDCQLETSTGRQTEWSYIIKKNPDEIKTLALCLVMHDYNAMIGLPCSSVAHTLCRNKKSYSCTGTVTFNIPHHSAAPLRPVSDYRTLLSPQKNTKTNVISQTSCQTAFRSRCTAPCWVNTVRHTHTHTHTLQSLHCLFIVADIFPSALLLCCCFWRSRFWPGVMMMMMLIITLCGVTTLNGVCSGHRLPDPSVLFLWCF